MLKFVKGNLENIDGVQIYPHDLITYILHLFCGAILVGGYRK